jgi:ribonuclease HI
VSHVDIYTDGACRGNPGPGGWAALLLTGEHKKEISGSEPVTTNNRMELLAAIRGLEALKKPGTRARVFTDSQYVIKGISEWLAGWKKRGWKTADKKPVKNQDLWEQLDALAATHEL